jgi:two-component system, cell cycle response regulator CpdR
VSANNRIVSIVEDEPSTAQLFDDALSAIKGIKVLKFIDPIMALDHVKINAKDYTLVICDLRMPIINGVQLLMTVKDLNPLVRTILVTAFEIDDNLFQEYTKKEIINGFLQKPIELKKLLAEVDKQINDFQTMDKK